jgi:biotin transport system substrate-specific component
MSARSLVRIAVMAAVIAALGLVPGIYVPVAAGIPFTAQSLGIMLAGLVLGARAGALAVLLFLAVVALGAPFLAGGRGGLGVFLGPSCGYLAGFVAGAAATGAVMARLRRLPAFAAALIASLAGGLLVVHACGVAGLMLVAGLPLRQALLATLVFVPADIVKAIAAASAAMLAQRAYPEALAGRR